MATNASPWLAEHITSLAPRSTDDRHRTPEASGTSGLAHLWESLRSAERIMPAIGASGDGEVDTNFGGNAIKGMQLGLLSKMFKFASTYDRDGENSSVHAEKAPLFSGRGPTGHKNDPIYTVALNSTVRTLMPTVPTPGMNTRAPPIPGQRNLP